MDRQDLIELADKKLTEFLEDEVSHSNKWSWILAYLLAALLDDDEI